MTDSYVVVGKAGGFGPEIDLGDVAYGAGGFVIQGQDADHRSGEAVSSAGAINGDGFDDLIFGAHVGDGLADRWTRIGQPRWPIACHDVHAA
ncbi:MAG: hypothetical protein SFW09_24010 [Hyphomicrobiaceae bacterium]|nr:hypothetical protein [Hyphomicrobiaceae bacterium]